VIIEFHTVSRPCLNTTQRILIHYLSRGTNAHLCAPICLGGGMAGQNHPTAAPALGLGKCRNRAPAMLATRRAADRP
jgi:hypothetical protein